MPCSHMKSLSNKNALLIGLNYVLGYSYLYPLIIVCVAQLFSLQNIPGVGTLVLSLFHVLILILMLGLGKDLYIQAFKDLKERGLAICVIALKNYGLALLTSMAISVLLSLFTQQTTSLNQTMIEDVLQTNLMFMVLVVVIFTPLVEELFFRGVIYNKLTIRYNERVGLIVSACMFGLAHVIASGVYIARSYRQSNSFAGL